ncbi:MAG: hypothetical protein ACUVV0_06985 [Anaerolineae bacterium]
MNLKMRQSVENLMNSIVRRAQKLIERTGIERSQMKETQLDNLLGVAMDTSSAEVVKNFILYQVGRDSKREDTWRYKGFGQELVREIDRLRNDIAKQVVGQVKERPSEKEIDDVWIYIIRQYLGQLRRYFYYRKKEYETREGEKA